MSFIGADAEAFTKMFGIEDKYSQEWTDLKSKLAMANEEDDDGRCGDPTCEECYPDGYEEDDDLVYKKYQDKTLYTYRTFWKLNSRVNELLTILMHNITDEKITHPLYFRTEEEAKDNYFITQEEFDSKLEEQGFYGTMDELYNLQEAFAERNQYKYSGNHISWWTSERLIEYLKKAGFEDIKISSVRGSAIPEMRTHKFDVTRPKWSVIIEAKK